MKSVLARRHAVRLGTTGLSRVLPQVQLLTRLLSEELPGEQFKIDKQL